MKKIILALLIVIFFTPFAFADRNTSTTKGYSSSTLIKRGDWKIYRISYVVTTASGNFTIYDAVDTSQFSNTYVKTEGSEAVSLNGKVLDFSKKPLEGSTGLYIVITTCNVIVEYE